MAHTVTLSDDEYAALAELAAREGRTVDDLVRTTLAERFARMPDAETPPPSTAPDAPAAQAPSAQPPEPPRMTQEAFLQLLYRQGIISNIPDRQPLSPEEEAEREQRAQSIKQGKPVSDIVFENRGPR